MPRVLRREISVDLLTWKNLNALERRLIRAAVKVREKSYSPYSNYRVGAALVSVSGKIHVGCNVERATYTQTTHAEQAALDRMIAVEGREARFKMMAIIGGPASEHPVFPIALAPNAEIDWDKVNPSCGHCLQCDMEHRVDKDAILIEPYSNGLIGVTTLGDALPMRFGPAQLGIKA